MHLTLGAGLAAAVGAITAGAWGGPPPDPNWWQRVDLNADNFITVAGDALPFRGMIGEGCW